MANLSLKVTLSALDGLTTPLKNAQKALKNVNTEAERLKNAFRSSAFKDNGINQLKQNVDSLTESTKKSTSAFEKQAKAAAQLKDIASNALSALQEKSAAVLKGSLDEAAKYQTMTEKFNQFGMGDAALKDAEKFVKANKLKGVSQTEMLTLFTEAQGIFRESGAKTVEQALHEAKFVAPTLAKLKVASKGLDIHGEGLSEDKMMEFLRFAEQYKGLSSPERFKAVTEGGFKSIQSSGGAVNWQQYREFLSRAGVAGLSIDPKALFGKLEPIIGESKGAATGVGLMSAYQRLVAGKMENAAAQRMVDLGIWQKDAVIFNQLGQVKRIKKGQELLKKEYADLLATDPVDFYLKVVLPKFQERGYDAKRIERETSFLFGRTGGAIFAQIYNTRNKIAASVKSFEKARGLDAAYAAVNKTYAGKQMDFEARWDDFKLALGKDSGLLDLVTKALNGLANAVGAVTLFAQNHPVVAKFTVAILAGVASLGAIAAVITIVKASFIVLAPALAAVITPFTMFGIAAGAAALLIYRNWGDIKNFFLKLHGDAVNWGANLIEGVMNGIDSMIGNLKAKMLSVGESVKTWFTGILGIQSPSKVFIGYGENINQGLAIGLSKQQQPIQQSKDLAHNVMAFFQKEGWSVAQSAGIAANLKHESGFNAKAVGDGGKAYGIGQWHPDRQAIFAKVFGHSIKKSTLEEQLKFVQYELTHNESRAGNALKNEIYAKQAGAIVSKLYERPKYAQAEALKRGATAAKLANSAAPGMALDIPTDSPQSGGFDSAPAMAGNNNNVITYHQTISINVQVPAGMDTREAAAMIERQFKKESRARNGQLFDGDY